MLLAGLFEGIQINLWAFGTGEIDNIFVCMSDVRANSGPFNWYAKWMYNLFDFTCRKGKANEIVFIFDE